jgi:hypothetical protein
VGHFHDEKVAALMRDEAVWEELGTYADLNFPENKEDYEKHKQERFAREKQERKEHANAIEDGESADSEEPTKTKKKASKRRAK